MKKFTEIREARRSAQDRLSARAAKHGLGSQKRLNKIKKASDFFSKPPPSFSKDELKKMGYAVETSKVPAGMKFIASYVYKDANGKDHTHRHLRKGSKMNDPVVVYIDDKEWKTFQSFTKAKQAAINHIKGMKESIHEAAATNVNKIRAAYRDFMKKKGKNFEEIAMSLTMIANRMTRDDYKSEKIIKDESSRIQGIVNKTYSTEEGKEIRALLIKHKIYGNGSPLTAIQKLTWE